MKRIGGQRRTRSGNSCDSRKTELASATAHPLLIVCLADPASFDLDNPLRVANQLALLGVVRLAPQSLQSGSLAWTRGASSRTDTASMANTTVFGRRVGASL